MLRQSQKKLFARQIRPALSTMRHVNARHCRTCIAELVLRFLSRFFGSFRNRSRVENRKVFLHQLVRDLFRRQGTKRSRLIDAGEPETPAK